MNVTQDLTAGEIARLGPERRLSSATSCYNSRKSIARGKPPRKSCHPKLLGNLTVVMDDTDIDNTENLQSWRDWIGKRVSISGIKFGVLRYFGNTEFSAGTWCGVELDEPVGKNNGTVKGVQYFVCEERYGIFAPLSKTTKMLHDETMLLPPKKTISKLPSPKVKPKFVPNDNDGNRTFDCTSHDFNKTIRLNDNNPESNAFSEALKKLRRQSMQIGDNRRISFGYDHMRNNNDIIPPKHMERDFSQSTNIQLSSPTALIDNQSGLFDKTVMINDDGSFSTQYLKLDTTFSLVEDDLLNASLNALPADAGSLQDRRESTFILGKQCADKMHDLDRVLDEHFGPMDDPFSIDCDESLGILSPSDMKDFTSSLENTFVDAPHNLGNIPKKESCDDVKDLPEFEVQNITPVFSQQPLITDKLLIDHANRNALNLNDGIDNLLGNQDGDEQQMHSSPDEPVMNKETEFIHLLPAVVKEVELKEVPCVGDSQSDSANDSQFCLSDGMNYDTFRASLCAKAMNSSGTRKDDRTLINIPFNSSFSEATVCQMNLPCDNANQTFAAPSQSDQVQSSRLEIGNNSTYGGKTRLLSVIMESGNSFLAINDETMPGVALSFSELEGEKENSTDIFSMIPDVKPSSVVNNSEPLISFDSPLHVAASNTRDISHKKAEVTLDSVNQNRTTFIEQIHKLNNLGCAESGREDKVEEVLNTTDLLSLVDIIPKLGSGNESNCNAKGLSLFNAISDKTDFLTFSPVYSTCLSTVQSDQIESEPQNQTSAIVPDSAEDTEPLQSKSEGLNKTQTISPLIIDVDQETQPKSNIEHSIVEVVNQPLLVDLSSNSLPVAYTDKAGNVLPPTFDLNQTYQKELLERTKSSEVDNLNGFQHRDICIVENEGEKTSSPLVGQNLVDGAQTQSFEKEIANLSSISCDFTFEISNVSDMMNATVCTSVDGVPGMAMKENAANKHKFTPVAGRKSMFSNIDLSKTNLIKQSTPLHSSKTFFSKNKIHDTNKSVSKNQENVKAAPPQRKSNKWDAITSKISAGMRENKSPKVAKEIASKVNTNLTLVHHSTPKTSPGQTAKFKKTTVNNKLASTATKMLKSGFIIGKQENDEKNEQKESRILTQLQNVDNSSKQPNEFKVPNSLAKKKMPLKNCSQLPSPAESSTSSAPSLLKIGANSRKSTVPKIRNAQQSKPKPEVVTAAAVQPKIMGRPIGGKAVQNNKDCKPNRWSTGSQPKSTPAKAEPRKFISKTELVREIQELGANCENRTKELNLLKIRLRHATLGFEALAVLNRYMTEEYDPFIQPRLLREYETAKEELYKAGDQLQIYRKQLDNLRAVHADELMELTEKLDAVHADEINELKTKHTEELAEVDFHHKQQVKKLKETFKKEAEENDELNCQMFKELQEDYKKQKQDLEDSHAKKLRDAAAHHEEVQHEMHLRLENLHNQYSTLQRQLKDAEYAFMKDKNAKIQYMSAKKTELEREVDSLKAVLEIKTTQIQDLHKENFKIKKELEELPAAKEKIRKLELKTEDLKAVMHEKVKLHRELSNENQQLVIICEKEAKVNSRLSMANEELQWRLQQSMETSLRSTSLCASPEMWNREDSSSEDQRSSSRMSLPILQSERIRSNADSPIQGLLRPEDRPTARAHSMSLSWHPALPTHAEAPLFPQSSTPLQRERSWSVKGSRTNPSPQSRLSTIKLKRDIEADILRRNSALGKRLPTAVRPSVVSHPMSMSWGGESFADYYEEMDDSCVEICAEQRSGLSRKFFVKYESADKNKKGRKSKHITDSVPEHDFEVDTDKCLSGLASLQSSYYSSSDSCSSYMPTQPGSEESASSSSSNGEKSQGTNLYESGPPVSGVNHPRELAGESMVQELESFSRALLQEAGLPQPKTNNGSSITDMSSSSPDDAKDNGMNLASMATPSIETSSLGMADSTNLDVSWGDEEMPSEND